MRPDLKENSNTQILEQNINWHFVKVLGNVNDACEKHSENLVTIMCPVDYSPLAA